MTLVMVLFTFVFSACTKRPAEANVGGWTLDGSKSAKLADYKGRVVVLDFYATWCEPCRAETPHLVQLQRQYEGKGLQVIGLNVGGEDDRDKVAGFAREFGIQYPLGFPDDNLVDSYLSDNQDIPQTFVVDRNGRIVKRFVRYNEDVERELERVVQTSLRSDQ
jgi:thiol-disulfide isomerase/thioredoxin